MEKFKVLTGLALFMCGLIFGSAEPITWNLPVGLGMALIGGFMLRKDINENQNEKQTK